MKNLSEQLNSYSKKDYYPFHMPGHKRNPFSVAYHPSLETDITEIEDFDDLHHAEGILREAQERAAALYGSRRTWYSVNGSTAALLSAISACTTVGGKILVARNCHKSVYHGIYLRQLSAVYLYPKMEESFGISGGISPEDVRDALRRERDAEAVLITSPTYDGVVSDVGKIAKYCREAGVPLIVDEAHGAHFSFHPYFPESALRKGADIVVQSLHKTLPSMTQTALLHLNSGRVSPARLSRFMGIYQTSSPSYPLMAGMDSCICMLKEQGGELFERYVGLLEDLYEQIRACARIRAVGRGIVGSADIFDLDRSKIILTAGIGTGGWLYRRLLGDFHLQMEMKAPDYVLGITSIADTEEGFRRLSDAVRTLGEAADLSPGMMRRKPWDGQPGCEEMRIHMALDARQRRIPLGGCAGHIAGDFLSLYPPGIPLAVPGERITLELAEYLKYCLDQGFEVYGVDPDGCVGVVYE